MTELPDSSEERGDGKRNGRSRSPLLFLGGAVLLGLALSLLLFGGSFFNRPDAANGILQQLPAPFGTVKVAELPEATLDLW